MPAQSRRAQALPLWLKVAYTVFLVFWVPAYVRFYGPQNFLWLCDLANFLILAGLWLESPLLLSSQAVSVLLIDAIWIVDVAGALVAGTPPLGATEYMFNADIPLDVRLFSLFHAWMPLLLGYAIWRVGYDRRGWRLQTAICWAILPASFVLTDPYRAINWVWGPFGEPQTWIPDWLYLLVCMAAYPVLIYLPTHALLAWSMRRSPR